MSQGNPDQRSSNKRTGLILASVAFAFFCGILARKLLLG